MQASLPCHRHSPFRHTEAGSKFVRDKMTFKRMDDPAPSLNRSLASQIANDEADLAGYRIYYSKKSRLEANGHSPRYEYNFEVGKQITTFTIPNLAPEPYYIALTAFDVSGNESAFSDQSEIQFHQILGLLMKLRTYIAVLY